MSRPISPYKSPAKSKIPSLKNSINKKIDFTEKIDNDKSLSNHSNDIIQSNLSKANKSTVSVTNPPLSMTETKPIEVKDIINTPIVAQQIPATQRSNAFTVFDLKAADSRRNTKELQPERDKFINPFLHEVIEKESLPFSSSFKQASTLKLPIPSSEVAITEYVDDYNINLAQCHVASEGNVISPNETKRKINLIKQKTRETNLDND